MKQYLVGDTFKLKRGRVEYTVVATFSHDGENMFVGAQPASWGYSYKVFCYDEESEEVFIHS